MAIASGSSGKSVMPVVELLQIEVDEIITAEDVAKGKPNPDLFLKAGERLGNAPDKCIVIEDSDAGIQAAEAAGMKAMRFYNDK